MSTTLAEGTVFAGRYRLVRCLATGGMGAVYEAVHLETQRRRALKVMHPHLFQSDEMRERFKLEARIAAQIESEYIVDVSDAGVDEATKTPFLVMELLRGEELGDRLKRVGRFPPGEVVTYLQQTAWALDRTHAASIVHRDLKPENLFLTQREDGTPRIKILDFGVAKVVAEGATAAGATRSLGTPLYMAPEQFRTGTKLTAAADIHALGMMAYTLLVGEPYWSQEARGAGDVIAFAMAAIRGPQEPATRRAAARGVALPPAFDAWFMRVTAVNPAERFPTASEAVRALGEALGAATGSVPAALPSTPAPAGPVTSVGAMTPAPAVSIGSSGPVVATGSGPHPGTVMLERAATSTGAAMTPAPVERSRGPLLAMVAVLGLAVLSVGVWLGLRVLSGGPGVAPTSAQVAPSAITAAPGASPAAATVAVEPAPSMEPTAPAPTEKTSTPATTQARPPSTATLQTVPTGKVPPVKASATPAVKTTAAPLLGRD
jgi:serine/threonine-protein kinase